MKTLLVPYDSRHLLEHTFALAYMCDFAYTGRKPNTYAKHVANFYILNHVYNSTHEEKVRIQQLIETTYRDDFEKIEEIILHYLEPLLLQEEPVLQRIIPFILSVESKYKSTLFTLKYSL